MEQASAVSPDGASLAQGPSLAQGSAAGQGPSLAQGSAVASQQRAQVHKPFTQSRLPPDMPMHPAPRHITEEELRVLEGCLHSLAERGGERHAGYDRRPADTHIFRRDLSVYVICI